jgi:hypothetical protein
MSEDHTRKPFDPDTARRAIQTYYATTDARQVIDDVRRFSPELATRLGIATPRPIAVRSGIFRRFAAFGRSIHRLFS